MVAANFLTPKTYQTQITAIPNIKAKDVGVGAEGTIWIISNTQEGSDYVIYRQKPRSSTWEKIEGQTGVRISVDRTGNAWVVTSDNKIFKYVGQPAWEKVSDNALDISCSPDGSIYQVSTDNRYVDMLDKNGAWKRMPAFATAFAGGPYRSAWFVGFSSAKTSYLTRSIPGTWEILTTPIKGIDVAIGANGQAWILMTGGGLVAYDEARQQLVSVPEADYLAKSRQAGSESPAVSIAVTPNGELIGVREDASMFRLTFTYTL